jgi:two-component system, OmpR family, sensor histidine kinase VicK
MFFRRMLIKLLRSLQWRIIFIFILIALAMVISAFVIFNWRIEAIYYNTFANDIDRHYIDWTTTKKIGSTPADIKDSLDQQKDALIFFRVSDYLSITVIDKSKISSDKDHGVIYSSDANYSKNRTNFINDIFSSSDNLMLFLSKDEKIFKNEGTIIHSDSMDRDYFEYIKPSGNFIFYFIYDKSAWRSIVTDFDNTILFSFFIAVIVLLILGYALSKTITSPIINLMYKAQRIAAGDFDNMLVVKADDEIGKLTKTFNFMAKELKNKLIEISSEKSKVETILNYMTDGVIAFNLKGEVIHINPAANKMLALGDMSISFNEFSVKYDLGVSLEEVLYIGTSGSKERDIDLNNKFIRTYFAIFTDEEKKAEGIITVLQDITEQQKLEKMRQEFVANVSHELRTPLTSIKSYTETLLDGAMEDREITEKFLNVINSESDRMTRLVKDLLQLSRLDNEQMQWNLQPVSFVNLVKSTVEKMQIGAKNKGQQLESYIIGEIPDIKADRDRIEQVVINIISNALKYTPEGGSVTVYIGKMYSDVYMKVVDTGIGIPDKDIPRIFERFYRVDKARSREMGGTGLGLSIAKEIVEAHGGTITISSEFGKGTEFIVSLPLENK